MKYITNKWVKQTTRILGWTACAIVLLECFCYAIAFLGLEWLMLAFLSFNKQISKWIENHQTLLLVVTIVMALGWQIYLCHFKVTEDCPGGGCY